MGRQWREPLSTKVLCTLIMQLDKEEVEFNPRDDSLQTQRAQSSV